MSTFTVIDEGRTCRLSAEASDARILIAPAELHEKLGWEIKPEGLCKDSACFPISDPEGLRYDGAVDLEAFARAVGRPLAHSVEHSIAVLGAASTARADSMESLQAPDFRLPDLDGRMHSLSEHRGKKVFLVAHASW